MRTFAVLLLVALACGANARLFGKTRPTTKTDLFGREYTVIGTPGFTTTVIDTKRAEHLFHPDYMTKNIKYFSQSLIRNKNGYKAKEDSDIEQCRPSHKDFFKFTAKTVAVLQNTAQFTTIQSFCFEKVIFHLQQYENGVATAAITAIGKKSLTCSETYLVSSGKHFHFFTLLIPGVTRFSFTNLDKEETTFISEQGISFMRFCDSIVHIVPDLLMTAQLFLGGLGLNPNVPFVGSHVPMEMQLANVEFIKHATGYQWQERGNDIFIDYDPKYIQSGDFIAITRFDGVDNIIHWGAGSHAGHSTMALWDRSQDPAQLYIVESQDGWYWPTHGLQRTKWEDWKRQAKNADFNVVHLPLRKEFAEKFDENKAWEFFRETEGMPYGYRNFLFGWIDTPDRNFPSVLDINFAFLAFRLLEKIAHPLTDQLLKEGLNWRVGGKDLDLWQIEEAALAQGMSLNDLVAIVEPEGIKYSDGYSYVCSSYVMAFYLRTGMLGDVKGNAPEFTPRDVYSLDVFDKNWSRPSECVAADPTLPYCQIMGHWKMDLPEYSSITPYSFMAERCPSQAPDYFRPQGC
jgi:hypothetical protein